MARDNESERLGELLSEDFEMLIAFAKHAIRSNEPEAKWQIAARLAEANKNEVVEPFLLELVKNEDEYVSRRALLALSQIGSEHTEQLAVNAWETNHEYQRIAALHALKEIKSLQLSHFIALAKSDDRMTVVKIATEIEALVKK